MFVCMCHCVRAKPISAASSLGKLEFIRLLGKLEFIRLLGKLEYIRLLGKHEFIGLLGRLEFISLLGELAPRVYPAIMASTRRFGPAIDHRANVTAGSGFLPEQMIHIADCVVCRASGKHDNTWLDVVADVRLAAPFGDMTGARFQIRRTRKLPFISRATTSKFQAQR